MITGVPSSITERLLVGMIVGYRNFVSEAAAVVDYGDSRADQNYQAHSLLQTRLAFLPVSIQNQIHASGSWCYDAAFDSHFLHNG